MNNRKNELDEFYITYKSNSYLLTYINSNLMW